MATQRSAKRAKTSHPWEASTVEYPAVSQAFLQELQETDWDTAIASWRVENAPSQSGDASSSQNVVDDSLQRIDADDSGPSADEAWSEIPTLDIALQVAPVSSANTPKRRPVIISFNPFMLGADQIAARYDSHKRKLHIIPIDHAKRVDSYIKFDWHPAAKTRLSVTIPAKRKAVDEGRHFVFNRRDAVVNHQQAMVSSQTRIPLAPANFGRGHKPDHMDLRLLAFYETAFCKGRTLLDRTNAYHDFMTMTDSSDCVRHCALALAAGYMLDYAPDHQLLRTRVHYHYSQAVHSLGDLLANPKIQDVGKEDAAVAALVLLFSDDIVNWELREKGDKNPKWRQGSKVAKKILDMSDPGDRYWNVENVQLSRIRASNANMVAYTEICALPVTPLEVEDADKLYTWLMGGSKRDVHQIHGGTGVSPRLLYTYAQITNLAARFEADPDSKIIPLFAEEIKRRLNRFRQWSELDTDGYDDVTALLASCTLDDDGLVQSHATVTNLTGETWVQAAKIYLYCRFFRLSPYKKEVQESLGLLLRCLERMPTSGRSFTAQSPFFCIVLAALVAQKDCDRQVIRTWFEVIVGSASPRSSVPPIWTIVQEYWVWLDKQPFADPRLDPGDYVPLKHRRPWWEEMVKRFMDTEGQLSLV